MLKKQIRIAIGSAALVCSFGFATVEAAANTCKSTSTIIKAPKSDENLIKIGLGLVNKTAQYQIIKKEFAAISTIQANNNAIAAILNNNKVLNTTTEFEISKYLKLNKDTGDELKNFKEQISKNVDSFKAELNNSKNIDTSRVRTKVKDFISNNMVDDTSIDKTIANLKKSKPPKGISVGKYNQIIKEFETRSSLLKSVSNGVEDIDKLAKLGSVIEGFGGFLDAFTLFETGKKVLNGSLSLADASGGVSALTSLSVLFVKNPVLKKTNAGLALFEGSRKSVENTVKLASLFDQSHYTEAMKTDEYLNPLQMKQYYEDQVKYADTHVAIELIKISNLIASKDDVALNEKLIGVGADTIRNLITNLKDTVEKDRASSISQGYTENLSLASFFGIRISDESYNTLESLLKIDANKIDKESKYMLAHASLINRLLDLKSYNATMSSTASSDTLLQAESENCPTTTTTTPETTSSTPSITPTPTISTLKLTGTVSDAKVTLNWNKPENTTIQSICYSQTKIFDLANCFAVGKAETFFLDNQNSPAIVDKLTNGKKYYFSVTSELSNGRFITSNLLTLTPKGEAFAKTGYTKIANDGSKLPDSANLGANPKDWACTRDNKTGLTWEVKTTDGGWRDMNNYYSWYEPDANKNGGFAGYKFAGYKNEGECNGSECDTYAFTNAVNAQGLCGAKDWRMPNNEELKGLVYCSDNQTKTLGKEEYGYICTGSPSRPTINTTYFPNTQNDWFWSSSPYAYGSDYAWYVATTDGYSSSNDKGNDGFVRLVR